MKPNARMSRAPAADGSNLDSGLSHNASSDPASRHVPPALTEPLRAICKNYDELVEGVRTFKDYRGLTDAALEALAGLTCGHISKMLGPAQSKPIGRVPFDLLLAALGVQLVFVEDPEAPEWIRRHWGQQVRRASGPSLLRSLRRASKKAIARFAPILAREHGIKGASKGGRARANSLTATQRSAIARIAAEARWRTRKKAGGRS